MFFASLVAALAFIDVEYKNAIVVVVVDVVLDDIDLLLPGINNKNNLVRRVRATTTISLFRKIKENAAKQMQQQTNNRAVKRSQLQLVCTTSAVLETHHPTNTKIEEMDDFVSQFPPRFPKQDACLSVRPVSITYGWTERLGEDKSPGKNKSRAEYHPESVLSLLSHPYRMQDRGTDWRALQPHSDNGGGSYYGIYYCY